MTSTEELPKNTVDTEPVADSLKADSANELPTSPTPLQPTTVATYPVLQTNSQEPSSPEKPATDATYINVQTNAQESSPLLEKPAENETVTSKPAQQPSVVTKEPTAPKTATTPTTPVNKQKKQNIILVLFGSYRSFIIFSIFFSISIMKLVMGTKHANACPVNWRIPHYLVVAGAIECTTTILYIVIKVVGYIMEKKNDNGEVGASTIVYCCASCGVFFINCCLTLFLFAWFWAGVAWVLGAWGKVVYEDIESSHYCDKTLYRFAFWILWIGSVFLAAVCCIMTCLGMTVRSALSNDSTKTTRAPKSEV